MKAFTKKAPTELKLWQKGVPCRDRGHTTRGPPRKMRSEKQAGTEHGSSGSQTLPFQPRNVDQYGRRKTQEDFSKGLCN